MGIIVILPDGTVEDRSGDRPKIVDRPSGSIRIPLYDIPEPATQPTPPPPVRRDPQYTPSIPFRVPNGGRERPRDLPKNRLQAQTDAVEKTRYDCESLLN